MFCSICLLGSITPNVYLYITVFYRNFLRMAFFIYTIYFRCSRLSPQTCCVSCSSHTPFCSCFVQLALRTQTGTKHERQCAPHDGSLATVCGNSRGSGVVHIWRFPKQKMPLILLSDISSLTSSSSSLQIVLGNFPNCLRKRLSQRAPANDEEFLFLLWR